MIGWNEESERKYDKSLSVGTFLGGLIFAALTGLISSGEDNPIFCTTNINQQTSSNMTAFCDLVVYLGKEVPGLSSWLEYRQIIIGAIGLDGILFIISVYGMKSAYVHSSDDKFARYSHLLYELGFVGILILFPFIVMPFSLPFGIVITILAGIWLCWWWKKDIHRGRLRKTLTPRNPNQGWS